jgi:hypothetical protein
MAYRFNPLSGLFDLVDSASPLTTKGDIFGYSTQDARIPVGSDGQVLVADSAQTLGVKWETVSGVGTDQFLPIFNITSSDTITIAAAREMTLHDELILEGDLIVEGRLILEL